MSLEEHSPICSIEDRSLYPWRRATSARSPRRFAITSLFAWRAREPGYTLSKDGRGHVRDEIDFIRVALLDRQFAVKLMVYTPDGHWATEQTGPCRHPTCTNAQRTT